MDIVFINQLKADTVIGVFDWERQIRQTVTLDVEMACDVAAAAATDQLAQAVDYKSIGKRLEAHIRESEYQLVETLAEALANIILKEFGVAWTKLTLYKPGALSAARDVGVIIERGEKPA